MTFATLTPAPHAHSPQRLARARAVAILAACACIGGGVRAQVAAAPARPVAASAVGMPPAQHVGPVHLSVARRQQRESTKAGNYYGATWGVQDFTVRYTASGNLIRFSYRVADPTLAKALVDKGATPYMLGQRSHAVLQVPVMDKVGALRQTNDVTAGKEYWMAFSNKGNLVRPGDRVNVMIGAFHADGLLVE